jgi:hypothetical protein
LSTDDSYVPKAATDIRNLGIRCGSLFATRHKIMRVRSVPITDAQIQLASGRYVPKPDPYNMEVGDELPKGDTQYFITQYKAILCCDFSFSD